MPVRSATWVARAVSEEELARASAMGAALGLAVVTATPTQVILSTGRGDVLEYCSPSHPVPAHLFAHGDTVIGFEVDDVASAAAALESAGFRSLTETVDAGAVRYRHFLGPEGSVYGLIAPVADRT